MKVHILPEITRSLELPIIVPMIAGTAQGREVITFAIIQESHPCGVAISNFS